MIIRLKKVRDGVVLTCVREGGSIAVQRSGHGGFFALHDLMHYAVETTLGFKEAFLGLMAAGWSFETFGDRSDPRYRSMPVEALWAEHLVAILSRTLADGAWRDPELFPLWAAEVNRELAAALAPSGGAPFRVEPEALARIGARFEELGRRWMDVPPGEHLELEFPAASGPSSLSGA